MEVSVLRSGNVPAAAQSMSTLINGADAGVAIISSAVAAANATLIRAHQVVGEIDVMARQFAQSPIGSIVGESGGALPFLTACCRGCMCVSQRVPCLS